MAQMFAAPPQVILDGAARLTQCGNAARLAKSYAEKNLRLEDAGGLIIRQLIAPHRAAEAAIVGYLGKLEMICHGSGIELGKTAQLYSHTDQQAAQHFDSLYKDPYGNLTDARGEEQNANLGVHLPGAADNPAGTLKAPADGPKVEYAQKIIEALPEFVSPSHWISEIVGQTIGTNPVEKAKQVLVGDWEGVYRCGSALLALSACVTGISDDIQRASDRMFQPTTLSGPVASPHGAAPESSAWEGKAAESAEHYFSLLIADTATAGEDLKELGEKYVKLAEQYKQTGETYSSIIVIIGDTILLAAGNALAEPLLAVTVFGAVVGAVGLSAEFAVVAEKWAEVIDYATKIDGAARIIAGALTQSESISFKFQVTLPGEAYDNTMAA